MKAETKEALQLSEKKSKSMIRIMRRNANDLENSIITSRAIIAKTQEEAKQEKMAADTILQQYYYVAQMTEDIRRYCSSLRSIAQQCGHVQLRAELDAAIQESIQKHEVEVKMVNEVLLLKIPHPINRYSRYASGALDVLEIREALSGFASDKIQHKSVSLYFWHIYPESSAINYPDNDNYLVKSIIDQICEALGLRDDGTEMFLFYATALTDYVKNGTYIIITPQDFQDINFVQKSATLNFLRTVYLGP